MIIKLTNAAPEHKGKILLVNVNHILTVFETDVVVGTKKVETVTNIYSTTQQGWMVKEPIATVHKLIAAAYKKAQ